MTPTSVAAGTLADFSRKKGRDLIGRLEPFDRYQVARQQEGSWFYTRTSLGAPSPEVKVLGHDGQVVHGVNLANQDYLSLASHPLIREAAVRALTEFGPHSAGSPCGVGETTASRALEQELAEFLHAEHVLLFPTGWAAGFGSIYGLVGRDDYIVMDQLAHQCLQQGAYAATSKVRKFSHLDTDSACAILSEIRARDSDNAILVITEGLFSMDSDTPDIAKLQAICHEYGAALLVDVAHDLGATGPGGRGALGLQDMLGRVDLVMGSFSKTFASNGGFLASRSRAVKSSVKYFGGSHMFSNAIAAFQASVVHAAIKIVRSDEGEHLRARLRRVVDTLRNGFGGRDIQCWGAPSPIVPVAIGDEVLARELNRLLPRRGVIAQMIEYPAVPLGKSRIRLQAMAGHTPGQAELAVQLISDVVEETRRVIGEQHAYFSGRA